MSSTNEAAQKQPAQSPEEAERGTHGADSGQVVSQMRPIPHAEAPRVPLLANLPPPMTGPPASVSPPSMGPASRSPSSIAPSSMRAPISEIPPSYISRPMTMPPLAVPADEEELDVDLTTALRAGGSGFPEDLQPIAEEPDVRVRGVPVRDLPGAALSGHVGMFQRAKGRDLLERPAEFYEWYRTRVEAGLWPFCRRFESPIGPSARIRSEDGVLTEGLNFAAHDYLSLATHPAVHDAARRALRDFGTIAGGSPGLAGNTSLTRMLEEEVSKLTGMEHVLLFTSGWTAGFSAITALIREHDHIVMDVYSHASLQQGAMSATRKIARFRHCDNESARRQIRKARNADPDGGILVITETLFSMDSDSPRISELQDICREYQATLLVDCAHDLGALGPGGAGRLGIENMIGKVDLLVGCFSKAFATNGGFLATHHEKVRLYVRGYGGPHLFSTGISPIQTAVARAALQVSASSEGDELRQRLMDNAALLRRELTARGHTCIGEPSALVPVLVGDEGIARIACALSAERGIICNLVEYPAVAVRMSRFRLQLQPLHTREQVLLAARVVDDSIRAAQKCAACLPDRDPMIAMTMPPPPCPSLDRLPQSRKQG
ncbi:MAG: aminotransferase class I/II-fold pyridoxal phosphate-dependent enzyme [Polyangiaceae bacterium]